MNVLAAGSHPATDVDLGAPTVGQAVAGEHLRLPRVNLLPPELGERQRFRRLQVGLGGGLLVTVGAVALLFASAAASVAEAEADLQSAAGRGQGLRAQTAALAEVDKTYRRAAAAQDLLVQAMGEEVRFSGLLDDLTTTVPKDVWLKSASFTQSTAAAGEGTGTGIGTVTFTGVGFEHDDVAEWLESLSSQPGYSDPWFSEANAGWLGPRRTVSFTSTVTLTPDALSGRYSAAAGD